MHGSCWPFGLACSLSLAALGAPALAETAAAPERSIAAAAAAAAGAELYLEVTVNGEPTGQLLAARGSARGLRVSRADLRALGLDRGALATGTFAAADDEVELASIAGLTYRYDAASQSLALTVDDSLRTPFVLTARSAARPARASATRGALLNYDAVLQSARRGGSGAAIAAVEARLFNERGVFSTSGVASAIGERHRFIRHDSFWSESDSDTLTTLRLGDTITSSLSWNGALRIGGIQWSKSFALRPDLATFPMPSIGGSAALPSALSLFVNGVQQYSGAVPGGPFLLQQVGGVTGAGEATVVTRDAFGRATVLNLPLYVDARMLAAGLSEYSVEAGLPRGGFGLSSTGYHGAPVASASGRYGWSDGLTVEAHGELAPRLLNLGGAVLLALGRFGVLNANLAGSSGASSGLQAGLGYQYVAAQLSIELQSQRAQRHYADLSARAGAPVPRASDRATVALALAANLSMSASYAAYRSGYRVQSDGGAYLDGSGAQGGQGARVVSLGATRAFGGGVFATLSGFDTLGRRAGSGLALSVSMALGRAASASVAAGRQNGLAQRSFSAASAPDMAGGAGWALQDVQLGEARLRAAQWQYLGPYGQLALSAQSDGGAGGGKTLLALEGNGALVLMDGLLQPTRTVGAGFALVSTGGVANVPVLHENRVIGVTDASGHLLVPTLNANVGNVLAIDTTELAADRRVPLSSQSVNPRSLAGLLVRFPIETYQAANLQLQDGAGQPLAVGLPLLHRESGRRGMLGFDGMAFVDALQADNHLDIELGGGRRCVVEFHWQAIEGDPLPTIGPLRCLPAPAASAN